MPDRSVHRPARERGAAWVLFALSLAILVLHVAVLSPWRWPAGLGLRLSGETVLGALGQPARVTALRPPDASATLGQPVVVTDVWPGGPAERAGVRLGDRVVTLADTEGRRLDLATGLPTDPDAVLRVWRRAATWPPDHGLTVELLTASGTRTVTIEPTPVAREDADTTEAWLREHLGPLVQVAAFLAGAAILLVLGARGSTALLMMLVFMLTAVANTGPLLGAEARAGPLGAVVLAYTWLTLPLAFPVVGLATMYFPRRAGWLDRHPWTVAVLAAAAAPMVISNLSAAVFLLGGDAALPLLSWCAQRPRLFDASYAVALLANVAIAIEGVRRFRTNPDATERRRIQMVVFTGVPAVLAYAVKAGLPAAAALFGRQAAWPWALLALLQAIVLLPAFGLPYAVAVRRVFSPRTVLRRSMQYALARRTIAVATLLPAAALLVSLVRQRDRSLAAIVGGQPGFYLACAALAALGLRYREAAERWLDRRFFRSAYDAREILVTVATRVPYETDPVALVSMVLERIDAALSPEAAAVLVDNGSALEPLTARGPAPAALSPDSGLGMLLRWSDQPLEVTVGDDSSALQRLPLADREWLGRARCELLVPILAGTGDARQLAGVIVLGRKRSEEPYTGEDRRLLGGIAAQMSVAVDLSRLRMQAARAAATPGSQTSTPTDARAFVGTGRVDVGSVIDGKYRVDALVGQGGMGAVYRARDLRLNRDVAVKVVRAELVSSAAARERFHREAQIVARLQHPGIVTVFDYGTLPDGAAYLVMEYVRGEDLRQRLAREQRLDPAACARLVGGVAAALDAAHREGILHRDVKPENILLPERGGLKVLDFGIAKATAPDPDGARAPTVGGTVTGTPAYMAPEQLRGEAVDARADVYSLGVVAYEVLTGRLPFGGGSIVDVAVRQNDAAAVVDTTSLGPAVAAAVLAALAPAREDRPPTPTAFAEALMRAVQG